MKFVQTKDFFSPCTLHTFSVFSLKSGFKRNFFLTFLLHRCAGHRGCRSQTGVPGDTQVTGCECMQVGVGLGGIQHVEI